MEKKKRGRKPKKNKNKKLPNKKRGRKPKGGKIIKTSILSATNEENILETNIILHLKCSTKDLIAENFNNSNYEYQPTVNQIEGFNIIDKDHQMSEYNPVKKEKANHLLEKDNKIQKNKEMKDKRFNKKYNKEICQKLKELQKQLHFNNVSDKKSDCFWCTYPFDNPAIYIPARAREKTLEVYGCFCSPECAVAYLNKEHIDSSTRWERYALLNNLYGKALKYETNIKPSPDPYYTLDKYYGNLSITEYRNLLANNRILLVINKPLTKILPELHEEKNDVSVNCQSFHSKTKDDDEKIFHKKKNIKNKMLYKNFYFS